MIGARRAVRRGSRTEPDAEWYRRQLEAVTNNATLALFIMDERQHCTFMNPAAERLTGYTLAEAQGRPLHDVVHHTRPDGRPYPLSECPIDQAFPQKSREQGEEVFVHKDGHFYPVAYTASPIYEDGVPVGTIIEVQDITARQEAERVEAERARLLAFSADVGQGLASAETIEEILQRCAQAMVDHLGADLARIWTLDEARQTLELRASAGLSARLGGRHGRLPLGQCIVGAVAAERRPRLTNALDDDPRIHDPAWVQRVGIRAFAGYPLVVEGRLVGVAGMFARRPLGEIVLRALASVADGIAIGIRRKQVEAELREQSEVIATINRLGQVLSAELDLRKLLQAITDATTELAGAEFGAFFYNVLDERGESYLLYTLSGAPREAFEGFPMPRNTAVFGPTFRGEGIIRLDDVTRDPRYGQNAPYSGMPPGHLPVRSYLAVPVRSRSGDVFGGLFFGHSEPGKFTERAERLIAGLVSQASVAIENAQLYTQAQEAIRLRDEFLSIASHELRNPVAGIRGTAQLLRRAEERGQLDRERLRRYVEMIEHTTARLASLTEDLLDVSRLRTGALPLRPRPTDLAALVHGVVARMRASGELDRVQLTVDCEPCSATVDADRIEQVVENLLGNAAKYSLDDAQIQIALTCDGDEVLLRIRDSGIGLPPDALERIFEPFGRAPNAVARNIEGLGLGLYICRQVVEQHGGRLWAESAGEGRGATMHLRLPVAGAPEPGQGGPPGRR